MNKWIAGLLLVLTGCVNREDTNTSDAQVSKPGKETQQFFPVTTYILGQVTEIRSAGINPLKITTIDNKSDSVWLKIEELVPAISAFLDPYIDSLNLVGVFKESRFLDQTIDAYTFTYEPKKNLPDSISLQKWDVYIDPSKNKVKRIYMVKKEGTNSIQLTWQSNEWCKIVLISQDGKIEKEELIKWKF